MNFDFVVIGSGFGGSVSALRLAEKGYSVCVIERGKRFKDEDYPKTNWNIRKFLWMPLLKCFGIQNMSLFRNVLILSGTGVGGGSLVYANTLLEPGDAFYRAPIWSGLADWKQELAPHYATAKRMLGVVPYPRLTHADRVLKECAEELGRADTFKVSNVGVFFGEPGVEVPDPYFGGAGPARKGCIQCGGCMVGCRHNAKNTLVKNYLYFAEKLGAQVLAETNVDRVVPIGKRGEQGYIVEVSRSTAWFKKERRRITARQVVFSAGVLGTLHLLFRAKHVQRTLPNLSERLGYEIRTNSEALIGVTEIDAKNDCSEGVAITSIFHPDDHTHIEPVRYPRGSSFMRVLAVPMADAGNWLVRPLKMLWATISRPRDTLRILFAREWAARTTILLVMQTLDNKMRFRFGRGFLTLFRRRLMTAADQGALKIPSYIPIGHQVARMFARKTNALPQSAVNEVLLGIPTTAHILGGCPIAESEHAGVIDSRHRVYGYEGMFVCDGSAIPANLGVNPSLTITAMTERAMSLIPAKS